MQSNGHDIIGAIARVLKRGSPTVFAYEGAVRYGIRGALILRGCSWSASDMMAADIIREAFHVLNAKRPPWHMGQPEYAQYGVVRIDPTHCFNCGGRLPEGHRKFCGPVCGAAYRNACYDEDVRAANRARARAAREAFRLASQPRACEQCGGLFRPSRAAQRFCSRKCSGGRSMAEKMNGKAHPWMRTGGNDANGAGRSYPSASTPDASTAGDVARTPISTSLPDSIVRNAEAG